VDGRFNKNSFGIIAGAALVFIGLWQLAEYFFKDILGVVGHILGIVISILGPAVVIAAGVLLVIAARKDKLSLPVDQKFYRSTTNKKIAGICGGIAKYLSVDTAIVRIALILLLVVLPFVVIPLYVLFWILVPPDSEGFLA
jgi:phage shock protein PspC (stress-responsive transcriptional regulator)